MAAVLRKNTIKSDNNMHNFYVIVYNDVQYLIRILFLFLISLI
jgi:hypothetical protein